MSLAKRLRTKDKQRGASRLGWLMFLLVVIAGGYAGFQIIPFYYYFYEIEGLMQEQANKASVFTDEEIRRTLTEKIQKLELPIESPEELKINRFSGKISIDLAYEEVFYVDFGEERVYDLWTFSFAPHAEAPI